MTDGLRFDFRITPNTYGKNAAKAADVTPAQMTRLVREGIEITRSEVVPRTPVGWSAALRNGYQVEVQRAGTKTPRAALVNPVLYHDIRDQGRKPGKRPPVDALIPWVGSKLGVPPGPERRQVAFLIARKIGQKGYPGANMVGEGWAAARPQIQPLLKQVGLRLVKILAEE